MKKISVCISLFFLASIFTPLFPQYQPDWQSLDTREIPSWWGDAKFGIFIHWGLYSVPAYAPVNEVEGIYEKYAEHYYNRLIAGNKLFKDFHEKHYGKDFAYGDFAPLFKAEYLIRLNGQTCSRRPGQNTWFLHRNITMGSAFGPANTRLVGTAPSLVLKQILSTGFQTQLGRRDFISGCTTRSWSGLTLSILPLPSKSGSIHT